MKRLVLIFFVFVIVGCARHVVILPEEVAQRNSADWIIKSEPIKTQTDQKM